MQLSEIRSLARTLLSEPSASYWSDTELNNYINYGLTDFCTRTKCLDSISTQNTVQYQADYSLPSDYVDIKRVEYVRGSTIYVVVPADLTEFYTGISRVSSPSPYSYNFTDGKIRLNVRISNSAASTTANGAIGASDTSITLTDSSSFPKSGRILIDSECIIYWNNSSNVLTGCQRGQECTTAASHLTAATVTHRDLWTYYNKKDATLSSDTSTPTIPAQFHKALAYFCAALGRRKSKDHDLADKYEIQYEKDIVVANEWARLKWRRSYQPK